MRVNERGKPTQLSTHICTIVTSTHQSSVRAGLVASQAASISSSGPAVMPFVKKLQPSQPDSRFYVWA